MYYCNIYSPGFGIIDSGYNVPYYYYLPEADESGCSYSECEVRQQKKSLQLVCIMMAILVSFTPPFFVHIAIHTACL